jgi:excisionase family DNA binding protein
MAKPTSRFEPDPIRPGTEESPLLQQLRDALEAPGARASAARLLAGDGQPLELPDSVYRVLVQTVRELAEGNAVAVLPVRAELTTQDAADLLGVSRPYLIKLIEDGSLPCTLTAGNHRRLRLSDVLAYRRVRDQDRRAALDEMSAEAERLGLRY